MNQKLLDFNVTVRLLNVLNRNGVDVRNTTYGELKTLWNRHNDPKDKFTFLKMKNFGKRSLTELETMMTEKWLTKELLLMTQTKTELEVQTQEKFERQLGDLKQVVKLLHNETFYKDEVNMNRVVELTQRLVKMVA